MSSVFKVTFLSMPNKAVFLIYNILLPLITVDIYIISPVVAVLCLITLFSPKQKSLKERN